MITIMTSQRLAFGTELPNNVCKASWVLPFSSLISPENDLNNGLLESPTLSDQLPAEGRSKGIVIDLPMSWKSMDSDVVITAPACCRRFKAIGTSCLLHEETPSART